MNFGHTIGHGIELSSKGDLYHGECVALGMICMSSEKVKEELIPVLKKLKLPVKYTFNEDEVCSAIGHDKKSNENGISTIFVNETGSFEMKDMSIQDIKNLLPQIQGE